MNRSFPLRRAASARPHPVFPCRVLLGAVLLAFGGLAPVQADDGLVVVGYGGAGQKAQEVAFFQPFTQQTGIPVVQSEYNGEMARIKVMADTGHADWDLVQVEGPDLARGCDDGLFERLDWQAIGGKQQLIANAAQECGSAALVWGVAIGYDADRLQQPPASWADFWDVQRFPGKRGLRKRAIYNLEFALLADGVPREQVYPLLATRAGADRAFAKLGQLKPYIQWWEAGAQPAQWLAAGDVVMTSTYTGRIADAHRAGRNLALVWPGSLYGMDYWGGGQGFEARRRGASLHRLRQCPGCPGALRREHSLRADQPPGCPAPARATGELGADHAGEPGAGPGDGRRILGRAWRGAGGALQRLGQPVRRAPRNLRSSGLPAGGRGRRAGAAKG